MRAGDDRRTPVPEPAVSAALDVEGILFRAALLAGYGRDALPLARRLAAATEPGSGRSCLEAGAPLQLTVDAPGPPGLRVGLRIGERFTDEAIEGLVSAKTRRHLAEFLGPLPAADHPSLGTWLFWTETRQSVFVDLRDPSPLAALARLRRVLSPEGWDRLQRVRPPENDARPWVFRIEADEDGLCRLHVHWLIERHASPRAVAEAIAPGCWERAMDVLGGMLQRPGSVGRWVIVTPLDDRSDPALRIGNSGWTVVPEDERKHRAVGALMTKLGGQRDYAEALWSLCRGAAAPEWRVGRACEVKVPLAHPDCPRGRLFFTPQVQDPATAGISSSPAAAGTFSTAPSDAEPFSA